MQQYGFVNTRVWRKNSASPFLLDFEMYTLPQLGQTTEQLLRNTHRISVPLKAGKLLSRVGQERLGRWPPDSVPGPAPLLHDGDTSE
jgi:hypothetical protein